jgi:hypothetical protein
MITRFISKGLIGIPDVDITLNDEKIILIQGPNGSGKTSLLKQITHPLASHNRFIKLKSGYKEGSSIMYLKYKGKEYKVEHVYTRNKKNVTTLSYLFLKLDNGNWENLTDTGLQGDFKKKIALHLDYNDYLYDILNIGIENKGIIDMTNTNRLDYLKKVFDMDILTTIKDNTLNTFNESSSKIKFIQNKLNEYDNLEIMSNTAKEYKTNILLNEKKISNIEQELVLLNVSLLDKDLIINLQNKVKDIKEEIRVINKLKDIDIIEPTDTYLQVFNRVKADIAVNDRLIEDKNNQISNINEELLNIDTVDIKSLEEEINILKEQRDSIKDKYSKNISFPIMEYTSDNLELLNNFKYYLENVEEFIQTVENTTYTLDEIFSKKYYDNYKEIINSFNDKEKDIDKEKEELHKLIHEMEALDISYNIIEIGNHSSEDDCLPTCPFRGEYKKQLSNLDILNRYKELKKEKEDKIRRLSDKLDYEKDLIDLLGRFMSIRKPDVQEQLDFYSYSDIRELLLKNRLLDLVNNVVDNIFYLKDMNRVYVIDKDILQKEELKSTKTEGSEKRIQTLKNELNNLENDIKDINEKNKEVMNNYRKLNIDVPSNIIKLERMKYDDYIRRQDQEYIKLIEDIEKYDKTTEIVNEKKEELKNIKEEQEDLKEKQMNLITDLKNIKNLSNELEEEIKWNEKVKVVKNVVSLDLPARTFEGYLFEVSKKVNELLDGFMTIRFNVTDGVDILCNRESIERYSNDLSQGEKSMLSIALLMAFKPYINWDILSIDEGDATLDEVNKDKFIYMVRDYSESIFNIKQIFLVSHEYQNTDGLDIKIIQL